MTFSGEETRHRYHKLPTALQHELSMLSEQAAARLLFLTVVEVTNESEVIISINKQFVAHISAERTDLDHL